MTGYMQLWFKELPIFLLQKLSLSWSCPNSLQVIAIDVMASHWQEETFTGNWCTGNTSKTILTK